MFECVVASAGVLLIVGTAAAVAPEYAIPVKITGPWSVEIGPGSVQTGHGKITLAGPVALTIPPAEAVHVKDEKYGQLPLFNPHAGSWMRGAQLSRLITEECTATGLLIPESVRVKPGPGEGKPFVADKDYMLDGFWANLGRAEKGVIPADQPVFIDYDYVPSRLDSVVADAGGHVELVAGAPGMGSILPPDPGRERVAIANIWIPGRTEKLTEDNLYPIEFRPAGAVASGAPLAETFLPKTMAKLKEGKDVTIVAWGDSVTNGGGLGDQHDKWYQARFAALLKERFPRANITMRTAAWGGGNSRGYMDAPPGGTHDFVRDVLDPKPDLVTIEFVNDAYLDEAATQTHYREILERLRGVGAEVILITPHLVRPDWMNAQSLKFDEDPRPYVNGLRRFAAENHLAIADASKEWCRLWRAGIPYVTLEANSINHPDARGHEIFAQTLVRLFR